MFAYILGLFCLHGWIIIYPRDTLQARHIALKVREKPVPSVRHGKTVTGRAGFGIKAIRGLAYRPYVSKENLVISKLRYFCPDHKRPMLATIILLSTF